MRRNQNRVDPTSLCELEDAVTCEPVVSGPRGGFLEDADQLETATLVKLATQAYYHSFREWSILYRGALVWLQWGHETAVRQLTRHHKEGDFGFDLAPMSSAEGVKSSDKLSTFALTVFHAAAFTISRPRSGVAFLLGGQKRTPHLPASEELLEHDFGPCFQ